MSRPAEREAQIARALGIPVDQVPGRLRELHGTIRSLRDLSDYLTRKGAQVSKSWLSARLAARRTPS